MSPEKLTARAITLLAWCLFFTTLLQPGGSQPEECVRKADVQAIINGALRDLTSELQQNLRAQQTLLQRMQAELQGFISYKEEETREIVRELLSENSTKVVPDMRKVVEDILEEVTQQISLVHNSTEEYVTQELRELQQSHQTNFTEVLKHYLEDFLQQCHNPEPTTVPPTTAMPTQPEITTVNIAEYGGPGWRRVVSLDMTDASQTCPAGLNLTDYSKRTCGRSHDGDHGCSSTTFSVGGTPYSKVCGRAKGYQWFFAYAFYEASNNIDNYYVHGLTLTHGEPGSREHIWSFAVGVQNNDSVNKHARCPCDQGATSLPPTFVGEDYFCENGKTIDRSFGPELQPFPLWDGQDCSTDSTCCQRSDSSWFTKELSATTTDNIELRLCCRNEDVFSDIALEQIELYVQ